MNEFIEIVIDISKQELLCERKFYDQFLTKKIKQKLNRFYSDQRRKVRLLFHSWHVSFYFSDNYIFDR